MNNFFNKIWASKSWWLLLLAIIIGINFFASVFHARFDLTKEKRYTLSKATKDLLRNLGEPVTIDVFLKGDFPAGFKKLANSTKELLQELKEYGRSKIRYSFYTPDELFADSISYADTLIGMGAAPVNLKVQLKAGEQQQYVFPVAWVKHKDRSVLVDIYSGGKRFITPNELNSAEALMEYQFINAINKVTTESKPFVGYAVGNGEPVGPEIEDLIENLLRPNYNIRTLNLATQPVIPDTFKVLLIVKPVQTFSEE